MATSIWKKMSDVLGFTTAADGIRSLVQGDGAGILNANFLPGVLSSYVNNIKNWDNDSVDSGGNSAVTVDNDVVKAQNVGPLVNSDGSTNFNGITKLEDLGPMVTEAVLGAIPELQRQWSSAEAQKERNWQTEMSNSAYQRSVVDMRAAGINPILAYQQGGASSGMGASASAPSSASSLGSSLQGINTIIRTLMREDRKDDAQAINLAVERKGSNSAKTVNHNEEWLKQHLPKSNKVSDWQDFYKNFKGTK